MTSPSAQADNIAKKNSDQKYRPDIDGLRAIAVILVLLFHFDLGVSGGFVGVDVFFVISGYLITDVIRKSIIAQRFSFFDFYLRRLLRLHPALMVTAGISLIVGFLLLDPSSFVTLANSATYSILSASNFYFWLNQGYFDAAAKSQPLLHTWSLAAEWQFYILWPFVVWAALKVSDRFLIGLLAVITIASLIASQMMLTVDSSAAYLMMPFRVFELSIGALIVYLSARRTTPAIESSLVIAGIALIIASALLLSDTSPFPGFSALAPCIGAAACIYAGRSRAGEILRNKHMVNIGLISYSVYLVHWPLWVFYNYYIYRDITQIEKVLLLIISVLLGAAMYFSVERIFMGRGRLVKPLGLTTVSASVVVLFLGCSMVADHQGMLSRIPEKYRNFVSDPTNYHRNNYGGYNFALDANLGDAQGKEIAIIAGDSFALQYAAGMDSNLKASNEYIAGEFQHGCILSSEYTRSVNGAPQEECREKSKKLLEKLKNNNLPLILAQHWAGYRGQIANSKNELISSSNDEEYRFILLDLLEKMRLDVGNRKLILIGSQPIRDGGSSVNCLMRPAYFKQNCEDYLAFNLELSTSNYTNNILKNFAETHTETYYIDPADSICTEQVCKTYDAGRIYYSDSVHLSIDGSNLASANIISSIKKITY